MPLAITCDNPPVGRLGIPYSHGFPASGGTPPYAFSSTALPPGLTIDPSSGVISGTPLGAGIFAFTVQVTDAGVSELATPSEPVVTAEGVTGFCNYSYVLVARNAFGTTPYSHPGTTIFGPCTPPDLTSFNQIDTLVVAGVDSYDVWRTDSESFPDVQLGLLGSVAPGDSFLDIGQVPTLPLSELPVINTTGDPGNRADVECSITIKTCLLVEVSG